MAWNVHLTFDLPTDDAEEVAIAAKSIRESLRAWGCEVTIGEEVLGIRLALESRDPIAATSEAKSMCEEAFSTTGLVPRALREAIARVVEPERERLLGVHELAHLVGFSNAWASQRVNDRSFPKPIQRLRATPVWREADVLKWKRGEWRT